MEIDKLDKGTSGIHCGCKNCLYIKQFQARHPNAHKTYMKRHYAKKRNQILLTQAFERYQQGRASQQKTLQRLFDAGFPVKDPSRATTVPIVDRKHDNIHAFLSVQS
jgi:hypothetical protein